MDRKLVLIESPYTGTGADSDARYQALRYLAWCWVDSLDRGECPVSSHGIYTQILPENEEGRALGLECRDVLERACDLVAIYTDLGITSGMTRSFGQPKETRQLTGRAKAGFTTDGLWPIGTVRLAIVRQFGEISAADSEVKRQPDYIPTAGVSSDGQTDTIPAPPTDTIEDPSIYDGPDYA